MYIITFEIYLKERIIAYLYLARFFLYLTKKVQMKIYLLNLLLSIKKETKKKAFNENSVISSLAPKILITEEDLVKVQPYIDKLKDTLGTKGINNIALTGGYGSGKSTLLKTFQHWHNNDFNFLNISLAAFNQTKTKENFKEIYDIKIKNGRKEREAEKEIINQFKDTIVNNKELEKQLEISILQQVIYKVKPSKLPESRFKRIINIPFWKLYFLIPCSFILWISSIILLFKYHYLDKLNPHTWILKKDLDWSSFFVFTFSFLGIGYFSKLVVELFSNSKINKVNLKGEIEIGDNSSKSILNEHYDEILYYFEQNNFNVVIIEDLDRFDNTNIFTKLRELNILLNNADSIRNKPAYRKFGIKFLYAVGDDLFNDKKERVKFFEYIIPVIPFINSSNANEQLKKLIKESDLEENVFTKEFLSDITTFIDDIDMRLLINIFHEFVIYRNVLKPDVLSGHESELFAMITYKNIDPEDFKKLNCKEGKLYKLINEKRVYIKKIIKYIDKENIKKSIEIDNIKNESISDIKELRRIYINQILTKLPNSPIYINQMGIDKLIQNDEFNELIHNQSIEYTWYSPNSYNVQIASKSFNFSEIQKEINSKFNYDERLELIESKHNNRIDSLQKEIEKLKIEKIEIENWDLKQIFKEVKINKYLNNFSNNALLRNLILEGYINENYNDYISLFHEGSLTQDDKKFEKNVKSGINESFDYELTNIENLIDNHIDLKYFSRDTILNFNLFDYLAENYSRYSEKYNAIIKLLSNEKVRSLEFIDQYINTRTPITKQSQIEIYGKETIPENVVKSINKANKIRVSIFIELLFKEWKEFWNYIYLKSNYDEEKKNYFLSLIIHFAILDDIISSQDNNLLATAINEKPNFLSILKSSKTINISKKVTELIEKLDIKFEKLDAPEEETKQLFEYVYNHDHYQINKENIYQMICLYSKSQEQSNFELSNYTTILESNCEPLIEYINSNINTYVENVYLKLERNKSDNKDTLLQLLNNEQLDDKLKIKIIEKVETIITDLIKIENLEIKKQLLINNKIVINWKNVIDYYTNCADKIDENLIKYLNSIEICSILSKLKISKEDIHFEINILECDEIDDQTYSKLLESCYYRHPKLDFKHLSKNKSINLIEKILLTNKSNYDVLRENFADDHIILIEKDFSKFFEKVEDFETDEDDILMILKSDEITIDNRFMYISKLTEQIIIDNKTIAKKIGEIILNKSTKIEFEFNLIESIAKSLDSAENKAKFINLYFTELSIENIISLVKSLSNNHNDLFVKRRRPLFNDNSYTRELLTKLKSKRLINSFDNDERDNTKIRAVANY
ncbi:hypothetical protein B4N84_28045 [Flavobacterium sp. IR1]|nr:hypothetical protein B4N84_28045 [Flavobacterium sp. IR1]